MSKTESVLFKLGADVSGLTKGLAQGRAGMKDLEKGADGLATKLVGLAGILGVGIGFGAAAGEALQFADAVVKVAVQTGMTTDSVQRLAFFATQTGSTLEAVTGTVGKMQENLVKAADGTDKQADAFARLKINTETFFQLQPDEQLMAVAQGLENIHDPAEKASVAVAALGKSGKDSIPMLHEMATKGAELNAQFERMGGPMSEASIKALDAIGDNASAAGQSVRNFAGEILALAAPAIIGAMEGITTFFAALRHGIAGGSNELANMTGKIDDAAASLASFKANNPFPDMFAQKYIANAEKELALLKDKEKAIMANIDAEAKAKFDAAKAKVDDPAQELADIIVHGGEKRKVKAEQLTLDQELEITMAEDKAKMLMQINKDAHEYITNMERGEAQKRLDFSNQSMQDQATNVFGELAGITAGVAQHNRALFNINKVAGIANAIISMHTGVTKSLAAYPMPLAGIMAAVHAAAGLAQVAAIKSTSFQGGGSGAAPSNATAVPTPTTPAGGGQGASGGGQVLRMEGLDPSELYSGKMVRSLAEKLAEHQKDGGVVLFS